MSADQEIDARDRRVAWHEAGHLTVGRALGARYGGATIEENPDLGYGGMCWGPEWEARFAGQTSSVVEQINELMPRDGEARDDTAEIYKHVHTRVVELCGGSEIEILECGDAWPAVDDRKQERQLAGLIFSSPEAQGLFIKACAAEARAILRRHADVLAALAAALLTHRTLDGAQIDDAISRAVAARQLAEEHERRRCWQGVIANANNFQAEQHHG
jgi:hypothetical protein